MPKSYLGEGSKGEFEGIEIMLPADPDKYLTNIYGDYMQPAPVEKRVAHHYCTVIDLEKPYTEYTKVK